MIVYFWLDHVLFCWEREIKLLRNFLISEKIFFLFERTVIKILWHISRSCKWWLLGNGWRNYWRDFRILARNRSHDLPNAGRLVEPLKHKNSLRARSLDWVLVHINKCPARTAGSTMWALLNVNICTQAHIFLNISRKSLLTFQPFRFPFLELSHLPEFPR